MSPEAEYETAGSISNVVFTCGAIIRDDTLHIYYGASDDVMAIARIPLTELWEFLAV